MGKIQFNKIIDIILLFDVIFVCKIICYIVNTEVVSYYSPGGGRLVSACA